MLTVNIIENLNCIGFVVDNKLLGLIIMCFTELKNSNNNFTE